MKCVELKVANRKGEALCILECGGVYLEDSQTFLVSKEVSKRMLAQYKPFLVEVQEIEKDNLSNGFYELKAGEKKSMGVPKEAPKKEKPVEKKPEPVEEKKAVDEEKTENKSMARKSQVKTK